MAATAERPQKAPFRRRFRTYSQTPHANIALSLTVLLFFSFLFPSEMAVRVGVVLTARKAVLFLSIIPVMLLIKVKIASRNYVPVLSDFAILAFMIWCPIVVSITSGWHDALSVLGLSGLELTIPYMIARVLHSEEGSTTATSQVIMGLMLSLLGLGVIDLVSGENIIARLATQTFSNFRSVKFYGEDTEVLAYATQYRFGLPRVRGPIEHSILYGAFFATMMAYLYGTVRTPIQKAFVIATCTVGVLFALSSAPVLAMMIFFGAIVVESLFSRVGYRWSFIVILGAVTLIAVLLLVDDPISAFITFGTLDPTTGFTRLVIWEWILKNLVHSPWLGLGAQEWFRPETLLSSIDSLWLVTVYQYGIVGLALLTATILGTWLSISPRNLPVYENNEHDKIRFTLNIVILQVIFLAFTVYIWGSVWSLFGFMLGSRAAMTEARFLPPPRVRSASRSTVDVPSRVLP